MHTIPCIFRTAEMVTRGRQGGECLRTILKTILNSTSGRALFRNTAPNAKRRIYRSLLCPIGREKNTKFWERPLDDFYLLDTDTLTLWQNGNENLKAKRAEHEFDLVAVSIITFEEALGGWYNLLRRPSQDPESPRMNLPSHDAHGFFSGNITGCHIRHGGDCSI